MNVILFKRMIIQHFICSMILNKIYSFFYIRNKNVKRLVAYKKSRFNKMTAYGNHALVLDDEDKVLYLY